MIAASGQLERFAAPTIEMSWEHNKFRNTQNKNKEHVADQLHKFWQKTINMLDVFGYYWWVFVHFWVI